LHAILYPLCLLTSIQTLCQVTRSPTLPLLLLLLRLLLLLLLQVNNKKTTFKVNYLTAIKGINGEVISQLAPNKKATVAFNDKQVRVWDVSC
jgi:hypothetical protein